MFLFRSGIPSLDDMFRVGSPDPNGDTTWDEKQTGIYLPQAGRTTSLCIAGPDGTGKSVLAMHFAARYTADCHQYCRDARLKEPLVFYVSTDLSHPKAEAIWTNFALGEPNTRRVPFRYPQLRNESTVPKWLGGGSYDTNYKLRLEPHAPNELDKLASYLHTTPPAPQIAFIDLASHTAGDDWGFVERLLAAMPEPATKNDDQMPRHLLLIDAMEGMETFAGDVDAFGQKTTRRGRVAKLMRLASTKCHLVLIIEEPQDAHRMPEQFVADVVLRLRATEDHGYNRRTIEIEKSRGQSHVRGRHAYVVRDGHGSTTGEQRNYDDPALDVGVTAPGKAQAYLDVFSSLHSVSRSIMENRDPGRDRFSHRRAGFGIEELDEMLARKQMPPDDFVDEHSGAHGDDPNGGLPCGAVSALIGDANTQKSFLGHAFLGHAFHELAFELVNGEPPLTDTGWPEHGRTAENAAQRDNYLEALYVTAAPGRRCSRETGRVLPDGVRRWASRIEEKGRQAGAVVLVTTKDENNRTLAERFYNQLQDETRERHASNLDIWTDKDFMRAFAAYLQSRTICRRLEIHDTPSAVLYHVIRRAVDAAQQIVTHGFADVCTGKPLHTNAAERAKNGWRVRFVLDDFDSIMRTYGRVHDDPLFLPFLLVYLRREGLSSLIIETQAGTHGMPAMFLGEDVRSDLRALSDYRLYTWHIPDFFGDHRIAIAAIPPMVQQDKKSPVMVRELEWYEPSSKSPRPKVNPRFELYAGLDTNKPALVPLRVHLYAETRPWRSYISGLNELWRRVFEPPDFAHEHPTVVVGEKAESYELMREICSLILNTNLDYSLIVQVDEFWHQPDALRTQAEYVAGLANDAGEDERGPKRVKRGEWFEDIGYGDFSAPPKELDRVPFVWDFGFLVCREDLWSAAIEHAAKADRKKQIGETWGRMIDDASFSWREVLEAASYVAQWASARQARPVPAFDLAMVAPQTFSCLLLEIWFSEIYSKYEPMRRELATAMERRRWDVSSNQWTLAKLIEDFGLDLYRAWLLLAETLDLGSFDSRKEGFGFRFGKSADPNAVMTRHWYKSAALINSSSATAGAVRFCRLPGHFSVRGDWFLATLRGSRSDRLADRALDLLSTRDANVERLMRGLGLPTRRLDTEKRYLSTRLRGHLGPKSQPSTLTYEDILSLGTGVHAGFHWLWRGNLRDYDASARIWERWVYRMLRRWKRTREHFASDWVSGFELYDVVRDGDTDKIPPHVVSFRDFPDQTRKLLGELEQLKKDRA